MDASLHLTSSATSSYSQKPNAQQQAQINSALTYKASNAQLKQAITEAKPVIYQFLEAASCQFGFANHIQGVAKITATELDSWTHDHYFFTLTPDDNHPKGKCLNVERINSWSMKAKNAFEFKVLFISEESGESITRNMGMRKEDGEWRVYKFSAY